MAKYKKAKKVGTKQEVSKRTIIIMSLLITMGLAVFLGTSYAIFTLTLRGSKQVSIQVGTFQVDFENSQFIRLNNVTGMSEEEGLQTTPYRFTITNSGDIKAYYNISLTDESAMGETTKLNTAYLHYNLIGPNGFNQTGIIGSLTGPFVINKSLEPSVSDDYELRLWLDENTPNSEMGTTYQSKIAVESSQVETEMTAVNTLLAKANPITNTDYTTSTVKEQKEMYTFNQDSGTEYRYIGEDPNNYITFNDETWRIIGVFPVADSTGKIENRLKILRSNTFELVEQSVVIGESGEQFSNVLNYLNLETGSFWNHLGEKEREKIDTVVWKDLSSTESSWQGKIALFHMNDYQYSYANGYDSVCFNTISSCESSNSSQQKASWIYKFDDMVGSEVLFPDLERYPRFYNESPVAVASSVIRATLFLKPSIQIISGDGSSSNPYTVQ